MSKHKLAFRNSEPVLNPETGKPWRRVAFAEVLVPEVPNVYGDFWSKEAIVEAAYSFMTQGFQIDIEHDNVDITGEVHVVESFIAREGDKDFVEGSWVVGIYAQNEEIWDKILSNELAGFSYEAYLSLLEAELDQEDSLVRTGFTEPSPIDGHVHSYVVFVDSSNRPVSGGTSMVNGHEHVILRSTVTEVENDHSHRYNLVGVNV